MTLAEHGVYNILLDTAWEEEPTATIPNDITILSKITTVRPQILSKFLAKYPQLWREFAEDSRRLVNPRLREEYENIVELCDKKRLAGIASAKARQANATPVEHVLSSQIQSQSHKSDTDTESEKVKFFCKLKEVAGRGA
jgi:uncharacterized protein YdaU (DUF1376 family)